MITRLLVYAALMGGALYLGRTLEAFVQPPTSGLAFGGFLFIAYLVLLYLEVRAGVRRGGTQARIQWAGFGFTAGVGIIWAFTFSTYRGTLPMLEGPGLFIAFLFGFIVVGAMWGVIGAVLTLLMLKYIFRMDVS